MTPSAARTDRVRHLRLSTVTVPLAGPVSDAKVLTGRQAPLSEVTVLIAEISSEQGHRGLGFSYTKRAGGPAQYTHAVEVAGRLLGCDPADIGRSRQTLLWAGASVGRSGVAVQAIAALDIALWDLKARRADLPLAKLLGAYRDGVPTYNTSGGFLQAGVGEITERAAQSLASGIGGIKLKVGSPDHRADLRRVAAVRESLGPSVPLMVDANQQWDRARALRMGRALDEFDLTWIEEPLDCDDTEGHARLSGALDTPIATGEMLSSAAAHLRLVEHRAVTYLQPDAPRIGGITPFLQVMHHADHAGLLLAPHFAMQIHLHLAAAYPRACWVEHFEWLDPLFVEQPEIADGRLWLSSRPGLGLTLTDQARAWETDSIELGAR